MRHAFVLLALVWLATARPPRPLVDPALANAHLDPQTERLGVTFLRRAPDLVEPARKNSITWVDPDEADILDWAPVMARELALYPASFIRGSALKRFVLTDDLRHGGNPAPGISWVGAGLIFITPSRARFDSEERRVKAIHHEIHHVFDYVRNGNTFTDDAWAALNGGDFTYRGGGLTVLGEVMSLDLGSGPPGFVNKYSVAGESEDKSEVFATLVVNPTWTAERIKTDRVLAAKVAYVTARLAAHDPAMGEPFWTRARALEGKR